MISNEVKELKNAIDGARKQYSQLVVVGGKDTPLKSESLKLLADQYQTSVINLNLELSKKLVELSPKKRILKLTSLLQDLIDGHNDPVIVDHTEILFDSTLKQDPLRLLQKVSRNKCIVFAWSGKIESDQLYYAEPSHPEFRKYKTDENVFIPFSHDNVSNSPQL